MANEPDQTVEADGNDRFVEWLRRRLAEHEEPLTVVAAAAGMSQSYLSMLRAGKRRAERSKIVGLAKALGVSVREALTEAGYSVRLADELEEDSAWECSFETVNPDYTVLADVREAVAGRRFHVKVKVEANETPEGADGDDETAKTADFAFGPSTPTTRISVRCGHRTLECSLEGDDLVIRIPVGRPAAATEPATDRPDSEQ